MPADDSIRLLEETGRRLIANPDRCEEQRPSTPHLTPVEPEPSERLLLLAGD